ncbi:CcmD Heme exporter protein D [Burkholderiaceae bacterium]|jgi:heme exporter protein D
MFYWSNFSDFLNMGGYALYVWGSYLVTVLVLVIEVLRLRSRNRALRKTLISEFNETPKN